MQRRYRNQAEDQEGKVHRTVVASHRAGLALDWNRLDQSSRVGPGGEAAQATAKSGLTGAFFSGRPMISRASAGVAGSKPISRTNRTTRSVNCWFVASSP